MIAALYVATGGCYFGLDGVDPWDEARDARLYAGPWPVVAHPPCERWGRYWYGSPGQVARGAARKVKGDDGGCFAAALAAVRRWGGVLEHPEGSAAWATFGLIAPNRHGGWTAAGDFQGWTCCVDQGAYGHRARKATWLYAAGVELPSLVWGKTVGDYTRLEAGYHSAEERRKAVRGPATIEWLPKKLRAATPVAFRDLLLSIAATARPTSVTHA